ncbi:MAG: hypothetical protein ACFWTY_04305 [Shouchella clausii]|jgi:hypothetical protein
MTRLQTMVQYWLHANLFLLFVVLLICINFRDWDENGYAGLIMMIVISEIYITLLSVVSVIKKRIPPPRKRLSLSDWPVGLLVLGFFFGVSQYVIVKAGDIFPNPSFLVFLLLFVNCTFALFSLLFPTAIVYIHDGNVHAQKKPLATAFLSIWLC